MQKSRHRLGAQFSPINVEKSENLRSHRISPFLLFSFFVFVFYDLRDSHLVCLELPRSRESSIISAVSSIGVGKTKKREGEKR